MVGMMANCEVKVGFSVTGGRLLIHQFGGQLLEALDLIEE